MAKMWI